MLDLLMHGAVAGAAVTLCWLILKSIWSAHRLRRQIEHDRRDTWIKEKLFDQAHHTQTMLHYIDTERTWVKATSAVISTRPSEPAPVYQYGPALAAAISGVMPCQGRYRTPLHLLPVRWDTPGSQKTCLVYLQSIGRRIKVATDASPALPAPDDEHGSVDVWMIGDEQPTRIQGRYRRRIGPPPPPPPHLRINTNIR